MDGGHHHLAPVPFGLEAPIVGTQPQETALVPGHDRQFLDQFWQPPVRMGLAHAPQNTRQFVGHGQVGRLLEQVLSQREDQLVYRQQGRPLPAPDQNAECLQLFVNVREVVRHL